MKRTLIALACAAIALSLTACGSMTMSDEGRYDKYAITAQALAEARQETERIRILALARIAEAGDDRTRDRIVAELTGNASGSTSNSAGLAAPAAPTHLGLEALRILGPGAIGLIGQGIGAYAQNQADILATERHIANNALIGQSVNGALNSVTTLGVGQQNLTSEAMGLIPPTFSTVVIQSAPAEAAGASESAVAPATAPTVPE